MNKWFDKDGKLVRPKDGHAPYTHIWKPIIVEDLDVEPIEITSKEHYKRELKKRGLECRGLM
jgi:hypothetical protein